MSGDAHVVVVCGITDRYRISYMDPDKGITIWDDYNTFMSNNQHYYAGALRCEECVHRGYPCHCYNGEHDADEDGID
ncbi:MAG: hypothetical protein FWF70_04685 [Bacteroidetes bacterium]|nr:hypothetical protein [Bacteroidota bacterium]MCL1969220.1 hypothetical protein [Bacteroidota bacterium]